MGIVFDITNFERTVAVLSLNKLKSYMIGRITYASPAWTYEPTPAKSLQTYQNKIPRAMIGAHFYVRNTTLRRDFNLEKVEKLVYKLRNCM